jgi:hypothetical protein
MCYRCKSSRALDLLETLLPDTPEVRAALADIHHHHNEEIEDSASMQDELIGIGMVLGLDKFTPSLFRRILERIAELQAAAKEAS